MKAPSNPTNPFFKIHANGNPSHARALARAFTTSRTEADVYTCCRYARLCGLGDIGPYLDGALFAPFDIDTVTGRIPHTSLGELRVMAWEYVDAV